MFSKPDEEYNMRKFDIFPQHMLPLTFLTHTPLTTIISSLNFLKLIILKAHMQAITHRKLTIPFLFEILCCSCLIVKLKYFRFFLNDLILSC